MERNYKDKGNHKYIRDKNIAIKKVIGRRSKTNATNKRYLENIQKV